MIRAIALRLAQALLKLALDESLKRALPTIYKRLDVELPFWFRRAEPPNPTQILGVVASATADGLGRSPSPSELALVRLLYDPVQAARNVILVRQRPQ